MIGRIAFALGLTVPEFWCFVVICAVVVALVIYGVVAHEDDDDDCTGGRYV